MDLFRDADEEVATRSDIEQLTGQEVKGPICKVDDEPEPESA